MLGKPGLYFSMVVMILVLDAWSHSKNIGGGEIPVHLMSALAIAHRLVIVFLLLGC